LLRRESNDSERIVAVTLLSGVTARRIHFARQQRRLARNNCRLVYSLAPKFSLPLGDALQQVPAREENVERKIINPWKWQDPLGFVQANEVTGGQRVLYCAGQVPVDADGKPVHADDIGAQLNRAIDNLEQVLREAGYSLQDVVRLNIYTTDTEGFSANRGVFIDRLLRKGCRQASTLIGVARLARPEFLIEIEATAVK
jgi:2-iminobutanoate/2-iminopropanoate deaminase